MHKREDIDWSWGGRCARLFGAIWGEFSSFGVDDKTIRHIKPKIRKKFDLQFKPRPEDFDDASEAFVTDVKKVAKVVGCNEDEIESLEDTIYDSLSFNFQDWNEGGGGN